MPVSCTISTDYEISPPVSRAHVSCPPAPPICVLLVEDDPDAAELARIHLAEYGPDCFSVEWSESLIEAMNRLSRPGIDVVLLDLGMPELSGHKTYRAIEYAIRYKIPVVVFTADESQASRDLVLSYGAAAYLVKHQTTAADLRNALHQSLYCFGDGPEPDNQA